MTDQTPLLAPWATFFVLTGGAAATLTGLMFVVITLIRREDFGDGQENGIGTFSTPTVMHFGEVLLFSAILAAPWPTLAGPAVIIGGLSLASLIHMIRVIWRARRITVYDPDTEDRVWYWGLPLVAYCVSLLSAALVLFWPLALFGIAAVILMLIFIGIRNAWDIVTFLAAGGPNRQPPA